MVQSAVTVPRRAGDRALRATIPAPPTGRPRSDGHSAPRLQDGDAGRIRSKTKEECGARANVCVVYDSNVFLLVTRPMVENV